VSDESTPETSADVRWEVLRRLDDSDVTEVGVLIEQVTETDGIRPLSEHVMLHLRYGGDVDVRHILARLDGALVGYAHLDVTDQVAGPSAELAVAPRVRRQGVGHALVEHLLSESPDGRMRLWAHGEQSGAGPLAASLGFRRSRTLWQMRRSLYAALPDPVWPQGVRLRSFLPGLDDDAWVALNARAFVALPDQGSWTIEDLHARMREPWFDPAGFLLAVETRLDGERILGFHWTKVHGADAHQHGHVHTHDDQPHSHEPGTADHAHEPMGEVYVVGIDPSEQGRGLGRALTLAGLQHLRARGLPDAMLYVDAVNTAAISLYESLGFTRWDVDVEFSA
jgi:mycothiol synthase